jgi:hypothetical protein
VQGKISIDTIRAALNLSVSHPQATPVEALDLVFTGRKGSLAALGSLQPTSPFGQLLAAAFDPAIDPRDWALIVHPNFEAAVLVVLWEIWRDQVLPKCAARYSFTL